MKIEYPVQPRLKNKNLNKTHTHVQDFSWLHCRGCQPTDWLVVMETTVRRFSVRAQMWGEGEGRGWLTFLPFPRLPLLPLTTWTKAGATASLASHNERSQKRSLVNPNQEAAEGQSTNRRRFFFSFFEGRLVQCFLSSTSSVEGQSAGEGAAERLQQYSQSEWRALFLDPQLIYKHHFKPKCLQMLSKKQKASSCSSSL